MSSVHFFHQASGRRHAVLSDDGVTVELIGVAEEFCLDPTSLKLQHEASGDFIGVHASNAVSLNVLQQLFAGGGSKAQPFVVDGAPEGGEGNGSQLG